METNARASTSNTQLHNKQLPTTSIKWRNPYDTDENLHYDQLTAIDFTDDPGMTLQAPAEEQDINVIMKRFGVKDGSVLPRWNADAIMYGDFTNIPNDPVEAAEILRKGKIEFMKLPADVRRQFDGSEHMLTWLRDEKNTERAIELGLLEKVTPQETPGQEIARQLALHAKREREKVSTNTSSDKEPLVNPTPKE